MESVNAPASVCFSKSLKRFHLSVHLDSLRKTQSLVGRVENVVSHVTNPASKRRCVEPARQCKVLPIGTAAGGHQVTAAGPGRAGVPRISAGSGASAMSTCRQRKTASSPMTSAPCFPDSGSAPYCLISLRRWARLRKTRWALLWGNHGCSRFFLPRPDGTHNPADPVRDGCDTGRDRRDYLAHRVEIVQVERPQGCVESAAVPDVRCGCFSERR